MYRNLNAEMSRRGLTQGRLAELIGMTSGTLSNKLNGKATFTLPEIKQIKRVLNEVSKLDDKLTLDILFETTKEENDLVEKATPQRYTRK